MRRKSQQALTEEQVQDLIARTVMVRCPVCLESFDRFDMEWYFIERGPRKGESEQRCLDCSGIQWLDEDVNRRNSGGLRPGNAHLWSTVIYTRP